MTELKAFAVGYAPGVFAWIDARAARPPDTTREPLGRLEGLP